MEAGKVAGIFQVVARMPDSQLDAGLLSSLENVGTIVRSTFCVAHVVIQFIFVPIKAVVLRVVL